MSMKSISPSLLLTGSIFLKRAGQGDSYSLTNAPLHTLLLCRHGDSLWNGGMAGCEEKFTGWTDVPLSQKGHEEAVAAGEQVASYSYPIEVCFTSILQRAQETAAYCLKAYEKEKKVAIPTISDYRLNERHYGALQGLSKRDVGNGMYGHDPKTSKRGVAVGTPPPNLTNDDPRRLAEFEQYAHLCGSIDNVPTGESLEQVAKNRVRPFLDEVLVPTLDKIANNHADKGTTHAAGVTGIVVAHANSLRALLGVICEVEDNPTALQVLESIRIPTGVPLILQFQKQGSRYHVYQPPEADECLIDTYFDGPGYARAAPSNLGHPDLPAWPLDQCIPVRQTIYAVPQQYNRRNSVK